MDSSPSKVDAIIDNTEISDQSNGAEITHDREFSEADNGFEKAVMKKVDLWLVGFYSLVYIFRVIDSANYSNAAIINLEHGTGIKKQLGLSPSQWAWTLSIFSYSYMIFEPTNTLAMKVFSPSRWMFVLILGWGISACSSSAAQDFKGMMCVRFAIGMAEAGFFPAVLYHMAFWYKPSEMPQRIAIFYSVGQLSPAVSGLLAYAIGFMDGLGGLAGWRWLFLIEGLPAIVLSAIALWLPDYPETARMLTDKERVTLQGRLARTAPTGKQGHWDFESLRKLFKDPTFYTFSVYWICHGIGGFGIGTALPTVIYELGFTTTSNSQLMNIPPYVSAFVFLNIVGYFLHRKAIRPWTTAVAIESTIILCYIVLFTVHNVVARYIFLIIAVSCAGSAYPVIWPERIRDLEGTVGSGLGIGWTNAMAQFSGIAGPHVFSTVFGPTYHVSYGICLGFLSVGIASILISWLLVRRKDRKRRVEQV
ncbi:MFS general substrate transporter [Annulohypoxylon maeteangense]|uniref:MFS general substrate transporter n=1 Tax=Annulohypoxylon maeteangense TaxID=1927788 RepID=UPI0020079E05|nr:MFS general substrate transporter [Annulohypoxylon maeteangense]KAI0880204.1 MFS general substrate transporter [Annulohypoxylon maeteangense]